MNINGRVVLLGDLHFGVKRFSLDFLENQLEFFNKQLFPYMKENRIKTIIQLGDIFDNRTSSDTIWLETLKRNFFDILKEKDIKMVTLLGNHDIALRESRDISLIESISQMYPNNIHLIKNRTYITVNGYKTYVVPWITKNETLETSELRDVHTVLGHFEIRNFSMVKGHINTDANLTEEFFEDALVNNVFSGHFHLKNTYGMVKYLGVPFQINWNDFNAENGFYVWDKEDNLSFFKNTSSKKHIKVKYNDDLKKPIEIEGLKEEKIYLSEDEYKEYLPELNENIIKFFINKSKSSKHNEVLYDMKENSVSATVIDNQEISKMIGTQYGSKESYNIEDTRKFIIENVKKADSELVPLLIDVLEEVTSLER